jgi:hypothetical protein
MIVVLGLECSRRATLIEWSSSSSEMENALALTAEMTKA